MDCEAIILLQLLNHIVFVVGKQDNAEGISRTQEDGTSDASEAELSTEDELDNDSEDSEYGSDTSNSEYNVSDTEVATAELAAASDESGSISQD